MHAAHWRCSLCSKLFSSERYLDLHLANRHAGHVTPGASACLADLCDLLHCAAGAVHPSQRRRGPCTGPSAARLRAGCDALADACFPPGAPQPAASLGALFRAQFCEAHSCAPDRPLPFPLGSQGRGQLERLQWIGGGVALVGIALYYGALGLQALRRAGEAGRYAAGADLRRVHVGSNRAAGSHDGACASDRDRWAAGYPPAAAGVGGSQLFYPQGRGTGLGLLDPQQRPWGGGLAGWLRGAGTGRGMSWVTGPGGRRWGQPKEKFY